MNRIGEIFAKRFEHWNLRIPEEDLDKRRSGFIHDKGWLIQYCFGEDEAGEYMDYYATHRMTSDVHTRIRADGSVESLPALLSMRPCSEDPDEDRRLEEEYYRRNREVERMLVEKGFDKFTINMILSAGLIE
ncbi:hypothetical protein [Methanothrix sp.]|uniref:hypothetical protein n=1 Tax=Methanothrix sp. TaxID=90426 RepID=UPI003D14AF72